MTYIIILIVSLVLCAPGSNAESYCIKHHIRYEKDR